MSKTNRVAEAYNQNQEREWIRLAKDPYHSLEFLVTWDHLQKHLPPSGVILDAGGGPGRYALELCRTGYKVILLDISSGLISFAQDQFKAEPDVVQKRLVDSVVSDIQDLVPFETGHFDAVLCLGGPLSHIADETGTHRALSELVRVARPGAVVCISVMGYFAVLRVILARHSNEIVTSSFWTLLEKGDSIGTTGTVWHFFRADELRQCAESCGLTTIKMVGCEGLSAGLEEATNVLGQSEAEWKQWVDVILKTCAEPAVVDMAGHILYLGRKSERMQPHGHD